MGRGLILWTQNYFNWIFFANSKITCTQWMLKLRLYMHILNRFAFIFIVSHHRSSEYMMKSMKQKEHQLKRKKHKSASKMNVEQRQMNCDMGTYMGCVWVFVSRAIETFFFLQANNINMRISDAKGIINYY